MDATVKRPIDPGQTLDGRFQIIRLLGKGGVGEVFEVLDLGTHRRRALKVLQHQFTTDLTTVEQFKREAAARGIADNHPAIIDVFTIGVFGDGRPFILMELLAGEDFEKFSSKLPGHRLPLNEAIAAVLVAADAVGAAHEKGLLHCDLKPSNIFRIGPEDYRVLDFGMARLLGTLTPDTGGTPAFSAPEQWIPYGQRTPRTDVFGLAATLTALITGQSPIVRFKPDAKSAPVLIEALLAQPKFPPVTEAPEAVQAVIAQALHHDPRERFADARAFQKALRAAAPAVRGVSAVHIAPDREPMPAAPDALTTPSPQRELATGPKSVSDVVAQATALTASYGAELTSLLKSLRALGGFEQIVTLANGAPAAVAKLPEVRELLGFSQNRLGQHAEAEQTLSSLFAEAPTGERAGLLARVFKDQYAEATHAERWVRARGFLRRAIDAYLAGFALDRTDPYCGVNALTLMEALDTEDPQRGELLEQVRKATKPRHTTFWDHAAALELAVVDSDARNAEIALECCEASGAEKWAPLSTARTLSMIARARAAKGQDAAWIRPFVERLIELAS